MIDKTITLDGYEYNFARKINSNTKLYAEYRNSELKKMKFFEIENDTLKDITDKEDLKNTIEKNYIMEDNTIE